MEEGAWFEQDSGAGMANWLIIVIALAALFLIGIVVYISCVMKRNKSDHDLQQRAIIRELALAKQEGVEIPDDLEKRLTRFQQVEDKDGMKGSGKSAKVHPMMNASG